MEIWHYRLTGGCAFAPARVGNASRARGVDHTGGASTPRTALSYEMVKQYKTDRPLNDAAISPLYNAEKDP